jgi:molybdopterin converting factor small subunit
VIGVHDVPTVTVRLPSVLAQVVGGQRRIEVDGDSVGGALANLVAQLPALSWHLFDERGELRRHVRCFCNEEYANERSGLDAPLCEGDVLTLLNSVAGG